ncbi:SH3 domain-containing protein [Duganella sp. FT50W]|uniref:SH3 domain-containing protein n=1 Tax=Duganella lactea TaxID=2692173 RepID=A0A6L8MHF4_9BURK|nr:SH3 domain-containing protein [Duganella lactea]MYM81909.1 SH3 domain-containing protein [Duganella lactea]
MDAANLNAIAAFTAGLIVTLFLAAYLTPRAWWRRPNARALCIMLTGAWGFGSLILYATHSAYAVAAAPAKNEVTTSASTPVNPGTLTAGLPFHVHRDLNLRSAPGVQAGRVTTVPAGAEVTPTGARDGDWWQVQTIIDGSVSTGWVSSLWLRRSGE